MPANSSPTAQLGIPGFTIEDLHDPQGLKRLAERFDQDLAGHHRSLFDRFDRYRQRQEKLGPVEESELLIQVARHISRFLAQLFGIEREVEALSRALLVELPLFEFKREFMAKRVFRKGALDRPAAGEFPALNAKMGLLLQLGFPDALKDRDSERALAQTVTTLLQLERLFGAQTGERREAPADGESLREHWQSLRRSLLATQAGRDVFGAALSPTGSDSEELKAIRALISLADRWTYARALHPVAKRALKNWSTHKVPKPLVFDQLVELRRPDPNLPETAEGLAEHLRRRDGFKLTDRRYGVREIMAEVDYCILCHERQKDSCARGFIAKDAVAEGHTFKKNPLGIPLTGCPLDERISEAHALKAKGDSIASLAMIMLDNPMVPGTGHRICNDCMKSCIY
ncbi:MAG TPA: pyridine nucleotide-disulfide oxidoreductase, partial [Myxococcales bacterium]